MTGTTVTAETTATALWRLSAKLPDQERRRVRLWITAAERALRPPRDALPTAVTAEERVRRARLPRPNEFYPGDRDYTGRER